MRDKSIRYKDTVAAPGSALHTALHDGEAELAAVIYWECEVAYRRNTCRGHELAHQTVAFAEVKLKEAQALHKTMVALRGKKAA